jgi:hypothetical protein
MLLSKEPSMKLKDYKWLTLNCNFGTFEEERQIFIIPQPKYKKDTEKMCSILENSDKVGLPPTLKEWNELASTMRIT